MPLIDLPPLDPVAGDPPALQDGEATTDRRQADPVGADDRCREVEGLAQFGCRIHAHQEFDGRPSPPPPSTSHAPRTWVTRHGSRRNHPQPAAPTSRHRRPTCDDADPRLGTRAPTRTARSWRRLGQPCRRRLNEDDMVGRHADVVLPRRALELHRLRRAQAPVASHSPRRSQIPPSRPTSARRLHPSVDAVVDREQTRLPSAAISVHVRRDRDGQPSGKLLGLQESRVARREPGLGKSEHGVGVPEHPRIGLGLPLQEGHGPSVTQLHGVERPPEARGRHPQVVDVTVIAHPHRLHHHPTGASAANRPGPTRNRVPCRSGGNDTLHWQRRALVDPDHPITRLPVHHAADQPTCVWQSRGRADTLRGPRLPRARSTR